MEVDTLLTSGVVVVAFLSGLAIERPPMSDPVSLPEHVTAAAQQLGELHVAHERAKVARADVQTKLASYIEKLKEMFHV